jgi:hypothetical protein
MLKMPPKHASISAMLRLADLRLPAAGFAEMRWHAMQVIEMHIARFILIGLYTARAPAPSRPPHRTARTADRMSIWSTGSFIDLHKAEQPPKNASRRHRCPIVCWPTCDTGFGSTRLHRILLNSTAPR